MNQGGSIFKDSEEDKGYNAINFKIEDKEKKKRKIKLILFSILGTVIMMGYCFFFFQQVANTSIGKLSIEKEKEKITYKNKSIMYEELFEVYGKPNNASEAIINIHYKDNMDSYRVTFSNSKSWGNGTVTLYDYNNKIIYDKQYADNMVVFSDNVNDLIADITYNTRIYSDSTRSFKDLSEAEIIHLVLRSNISFRGNTYILVFIFILIIIEICSIFGWEKEFEIRMRWYTNEVVTPSDTYEMCVRIGQLVILVGIIILLVGALV